jgi:hypothetical protein
MSEIYNCCLVLLVSASAEIRDLFAARANMAEASVPAHMDAATIPINTATVVFRLHHLKARSRDVVGRARMGVPAQ